jgi:hypothetical protein
MLTLDATARILVFEAKEDDESGDPREVRRA